MAAKPNWPNTKPIYRAPVEIMVVENAADLQFPPEFDQAQPLSVSEVTLALELRTKQYRESNNQQALREPFQRAKEYCQRFGKFKNVESCKRVRELLEKHTKFHKFEIAMLANLCPQTPEEAKSLIPSLEEKFEDNELQEILDDIQTTISFQ